MSPAGGLGLLDVHVVRKRLVNASGQTVEVLSDFAFRLEGGRIGALIGPSGCGKTSILRILAGLDGQFEGRVTRPPGALSMAFQEPRLLPWRTVEDNIRLAAPQIGEGELKALMNALDITAHRKHFPSELSLGLARRVALARAYAIKPALLLLDEPFVSLDAPLALALQNHFATLVADRAVTAVLVTHDVGEAIRLADRNFVLSPRPARVLGEIKVEGPRTAMSAAEARSLEVRIEAMRVPA